MLKRVWRLFFDDIVEEKKYLLHEDLNNTTHENLSPFRFLVKESARLDVNAWEFHNRGVLKVKQQETEVQGGRAPL